MAIFSGPTREIENVNSKESDDEATEKRDGVRGVCGVEALEQDQGCYTCNSQVIISKLNSCFLRTDYSRCGEAHIVHRVYTVYRCQYRLFQGMDKKLTY